MDTFLFHPSDVMNTSENVTDVSDDDVIDTDAETRRVIKKICYVYLMPAALLVGILGNCLNLYILSKRRLRFGLDKLERCALIGFVSLALSDMIYCLLGFPSLFLHSRHFATSGSVWECLELYYTAFRPAILNVFVFTSTWCTVAVALQRYIVVLAPLKARASVRVRYTVMLHSGICFSAVLFTMPQFFQLRVVPIRSEPSTTASDSSFIVSVPGLLTESKALSTIYPIVYTLVSSLVPLILLCVFNGKLLRVIYRVKYRSTANKYSLSRITFVLLAIIFMYIVLVGPSVVMNSMKLVCDILGWQDRLGHKFLIGLVVGNTVQSANFAINFFLYVSFHSKFRDQLLLGLKCQTSLRKQHLTTLKEEQEKLQVGDCQKADDRKEAEVACSKDDVEKRTFGRLLQASANVHQPRSFVTHS